MTRSWLLLGLAAVAITLSFSVAARSYEEPTDDARGAFQASPRIQTTAQPESTRPAPGATSAPATPKPVPPTATPDHGLLLPDLETTVSDDVYIQYNAAGGRQLRFSTEVHNTGTGQVQIIGEIEENGAVRALQIIETEFAGQMERTVGFLALDAAHAHWHLEDFAIYELWTLDEEDELETQVADSGKITFCLIDEFPLDAESPETTAAPKFTECDTSNQGISSGWGETYEAWLPGQSLNIGDLPDGSYALLTILDPDNLIQEEDESNNELVFIVEIAGTSVEVVDPR